MGTSTSNMPAHNARIAQIMSHLCAAAQEAGSSDVVNEPGFSGSYAGDYKIRDLSLHERGRKELLMAEVEMPGLMNCRKEWGTTKPLSGARVMGSLHMTVQTATSSPPRMKLQLPVFRPSPHACTHGRANRSPSTGSAWTLPSHGTMAKAWTSLLTMAAM